MCKVVLTDEEGFHKAFFVSTETPNQILEHYNINSMTKIVYKNGKPLTQEKMNVPIYEEGTVYLSVRNRTVMR